MAVSILFLIFAANSQLIVIMDTKEIGTIIRERRKHLGVNQQTLADLFDFYHNCYMISFYNI